MAIEEYPNSIVVDGEQWEIREYDDRPGQVDLRWVTGPAGGSGFTTRANFPDRLPLEFIRRQILDYMQNINPETGYFG